MLDTVLQLRPDNVRAALQAALDDGAVDGLDPEAVLQQLQALHS